MLMVVVFLMPNDQGCEIKMGVLAIVAVFREMQIEMPSAPCRRINTCF